MWVSEPVSLQCATCTHFGGLKKSERQSESVTLGCGKLDYWITNFHLRQNKGSISHFCKEGNGYLLSSHRVGVIDYALLNALNGL